MRHLRTKTLRSVVVLSLVWIIANLTWKSDRLTAVPTISARGLGTSHLLRALVVKIYCPHGWCHFQEPETHPSARLLLTLRH